MQLQNWLHVFLGFPLLNILHDTKAVGRERGISFSEYPYDVKN